jgi:PEP-CTERM motif
MKLQRIVAALALAATGSAFANVLDPATTVTSGTGGEMSLTVFSKQTQASVLIDTGLTLTQFRSIFAAGGPGVYNLNLAGNSAFQQFMGLASTAGATDISYSFFGGDNSGPQAASRSALTTMSGDASAVTNGNIVDGLNMVKANYLDTANLKPAINPTLGGDANGSLLALKGVDGNAYFLEFVGPTFASKFQDTGAAIGTDVAVYDFVRSSTAPLTLANKLDTFGANGAAATASLKQVGGAYQFSVTAVPEPSTYALVIAGLAVAGFAARRRAAK